MNEEIMIVTNNQKVIQSYENILPIQGDFLDVLIKVRDLSHQGYTPVNHPLPASIRMFYSPVRSIIVKKEINDRGIEAIENSIITYQNTMGERKPDVKNKEDYEVIDETLLAASIEEYLRG